MARGHNGDLWSFAGASLRSKRGLDGTVGLNNSRAWPPLLTTRILGIVVASELHRSGGGSYGALDMTCRSLWMRAGRVGHRGSGYWKGVRAGDEAETAGSSHRRRSPI